MSMQSIDLGYAVVFWSAQPTKADSVGCDGLYIERVEVKPIREWPLSAHLELWPHIAKTVSCALWQRISGKFA